MIFLLEYETREVDHFFEACKKHEIRSEWIKYQVSAIPIGCEWGLSAVKWSEALPAFYLYLSLTNQHTSLAFAECLRQRKAFS